MSIYLAFYSGRKSINKPVDLLYRLTDWFIRFMTTGKYSHCELAVKIKNTDQYLCYSSSGRDGGVRVKTMSFDNKWTLIDVSNFTNSDDIQQYHFLTESAKYDYVGCIGTVLPFVKCKNRYFCSEWVYNALMFSINKRVETGGRFSPVDLYVLFNDLK